MRQLTILLCFGFAAGFAVTRPLWTTTRSFPLTPVFSWWPIVQSPFDHYILYAVWAILASIAIGWGRKWLCAVFIALVFFLGMADQSRWHPWVYWYSWMMIATCVSCFAKSRPDVLDGCLNSCRILMVSSYIWAGLQKVGVTFYLNLFPWMLGAFVDSPESSRFWSFVGFLVPIVECGIGVALCTARFRSIGIVSAIGMHLSILLLLGPIGHDVNTNVWPWNVTLIAIVYVLFRDSSEVPASSLLRPSTAVHSISLCLFLFAPALTFAGLWDAYPGFSLYSGSQRAAYVQLDDESLAELPPEIARFADDRKRIVIGKWAFGDLNVPAYEEPRIYRSAHARICELLVDAGRDAELVILSKPSRLTGGRQVTDRRRCARGGDI